MHKEIENNTRYTGRIDKRGNENDSHHDKNQGNYHRTGGSDQEIQNFRTETI